MKLRNVFLLILVAFITLNYVASFTGASDQILYIVVAAAGCFFGLFLGMFSVTQKRAKSQEDKAANDLAWQDALDNWCCKQGVYFNGYVAIAATKDVLYEKSRCVITVNQGGTPNNPDKRYIATLQKRDNDFATLDMTEINEETYLSLINVRQVVNKSYSTL